MVPVFIDHPVILWVQSVNSLSFQIATPPQKIGGSAAAQRSPGAEDIRSAARRHLAICRTLGASRRGGTGSRRWVFLAMLRRPIAPDPFSARLEKFF
jgi:hypothetical protein